MTPKDWGMESETLFRDARRALSPTAQDRARVRERLAAQLAAGAAAASVATATSKATVASKSALYAKILASIALVTGATLVVGPRAFTKSDATRAIVAPAPTKAAIARIVERSRIAPPPVAAAVTRDEVVPAPRPVVRPAPSGVASADEVALVAELDGALRAGDAARALRLAADHERRFPRGLLVEERDGARVIARCINGSTSNADAFLAAHPRSPMRARITSACAVKE